MKQDYLPDLLNDPKQDYAWIPPTRPIDELHQQIEEARAEIARADAETRELHL